MDREARILKLLREPIIVVPATIVTAGAFLGAPFFFWGADGAASYFGSFTAALVAVIGVMVGALYNAHLERRRDERRRIEGVVAFARASLVELDVAVQNSSSIIATLKEQIEALTTISAYRIIVLVAESGTFDFDETPVLERHHVELCDIRRPVPEQTTRYLASRNALKESAQLLGRFIEPDPDIEQRLIELKRDQAEIVRQRLEHTKSVAIQARDSLRAFVEDADRTVFTV